MGMRGRGGTERDCSTIVATTKAPDFRRAGIVIERLGVPEILHKALAVPAYVDIIHITEPSAASW